MFTPQEIQEQTFSKAVFGGYDMQQVDDFLEPLTEDYIALYKENSVLKSKMKILVEKLEEYRGQEAAMKKTMAEAQAKCDKMLADAKAQCSAMVQTAEDGAARQKVEADIAAEQERLEYAKQTALNFINVIEGDIKGHLELLEQLIEATTTPGALILDPFAGSGSTLVAAAKTGRQYIGIEIDEHYSQLAANRAAEHQKGAAT